MNNQILSSPPCFADTSDLHKSFKWYGRALDQYRDQYDEQSWHVIDSYLNIYDEGYDDDLKTPCYNLVVLSSQEYSQLRSEGLLIASGIHKDYLNFRDYEQCIVIEKGKKQTRLIWARWNRIRHRRILFEKVLDLPISSEDREEDDELSAQEQIDRYFNPSIKHLATYWQSNGMMEEDGNWYEVLTKIMQNSPENVAERVRRYRDEEDSCSITRQSASECDSLALMTCCYQIFDEEAIRKWFKRSAGCPHCMQGGEDEHVTINRQGTESVQTILSKLFLSEVETTKETLLIMDEDLPLLSKAWKQQISFDGYDGDPEKIREAKTIILCMHSNEQKHTLERIALHGNKCEKVHVIER